MAELEPGVLERCDTCHRPIRDESLCWYIGDEAEGTRYPYCERCSVHAEAAWRIECEMPRPAGSPGCCASIATRGANGQRKPWRRPEHLRTPAYEAVVAAMKNSSKYLGVATWQDYVDAIAEVWLTDVPLGCMKTAVSIISQSRVAHEELAHDLNELVREAIQESQGRAQMDAHASTSSD